MSAGKPAPSYVIQFETGEKSGAVDVETVRELIRAGHLGVGDLVAKNDGPPLEFYHYDEFMDLWDVDASFDHLYGDDEPTHPGPGSASGQGGRVDDQPSPFLPSSASEGAPDDLDGIFLDVEEEHIDVTHKAPAPQAFSGFGTWVAEPEEAEAELAAPAEASAVPAAAQADFEGYDPLADQVLDPMTVRDLLYDSSLYTVLTVGAGAEPETLYERYLSRMELLAARQRAIGRVDTEQSEALDDIRRLIYMSYETLRNPNKRRLYEEASHKGATFTPAGTWLELDTRPSPESLTEMSLAELDDDVDMVVEVDPEAISFDSGELEAVADADAGAGHKPASRAVDFSTTGPRGRASAPVLGAEGPRLYDNLGDTLEHLALADSGPVGEIFTERPPTRQQDAVRARDRTASGSHRAASRSVSGPVALTGADQYQKGLAWGVEDDPGRGIRDALLMLLPAMAISLAVIVATRFGPNELEYASPSPWFYGRGGLLLLLAAVGTLAVRKEPLVRIGWFPHPAYILVGAAVGLVVGVLGAFVSPIYVGGEPTLWRVVVAMVFISFAHEVFFRGYVTRVLLVSVPSAVGALALSCLFYGAFYLTYYNTLQQPGFYLFYYSVFLFGFGLGSIYGVLYWKSRSIWPSAVAHLLILTMSMLLAP